MFFGKKCWGKSPKLLQMPNIRRGLPPGVRAASVLAAMAPAKVGRMASRRGRERTMPAPRRKLRRDRAGLVETYGVSIFVVMVSLYRISPRAAMHERQNLTLVLAAGFNDGLAG